MNSNCCSVPSSHPRRCSPTPLLFSPPILMCTGTAFSLLQSPRLSFPFSFSFSFEYNPSSHSRERRRRPAFRASRTLRLSGIRSTSLPAFSGPLGSSQDAFLCEKGRNLDTLLPDAGSLLNGGPLPTLGHANSPVGEVSRFPRNSSCSVSVAEAVPSIDVDEDTLTMDDIHGLLKDMARAVVGEGNEGGSSSEFGLKQQFQQPRWRVAGTSDGKYRELRQRQIKIETEAWKQASDEYKELVMDMCQMKLAPNLPYVKSLFLCWFEPFRDQIVAEQERCSGKIYPKHSPYFNHLPAEMMAVITMHTLMGLLMSGSGDVVGSVRVVHAAMAIGEAIENEVRIHRFLEKTRKNTAKDKKIGEVEGDTVTKEQEILRKKVKELMKKQKIHLVRKIVRGQGDSSPWGDAAQAKVGGRLIELLLETAFIQSPVSQSADGLLDIRPAFRKSIKTLRKEKQKSSKNYGVIECDPLVLQGLDMTARHMVVPYMPMLVPPVNWTGYNKGAYFFLPSYVMRTFGARKLTVVVKRAPRKQMQDVFEALNALGSTKWRVNKRVLSVIDRIWSDGGGLANLVDREDIPVPEKPDTKDEAELRKWKSKMQTVKKQNMERLSQRCDVEVKLSVARKLKDEEGFYYPHNVDFRGRAYPMHAYLNHLGNDLCRGILEFAEGRPLGKSGLHWLKIHLTNLYAGGMDKLSYDGRVAFVENHMEDIYDSADRPLNGRHWWLGAEHPFQCLAVCINLAEALRNSSPETTVSHLPVHQDGSCNGLQHYAALGRDRLGAIAVNLIAGDNPADVYTGIAARVLEIMEMDAEKDPVEDPNALWARLLVDQVDRKLVKQTVMTSVYGVTYIGARQQITRRLKERGFTADDNELFCASCYAAKTTLTALGEMFQSARRIMNWLGDCAKIIASENHPVRWTTPLGLPVVQPYLELRKCDITTSLQILSLQRETDKVNTRRQRTAFAPNFVHSLDASHMMMTAVACKRAGLNFAGVHDSYWTHACDVDQMNIILREKFVELHGKPILEELLESFQQAFPELSFPPLPDRGDFNVKDVLDSPYFFN